MNYKNLILLERCLSKLVVDLDVHWSVDGRSNGGSVTSGVLMRAFHIGVLPVRPVDVILEHSDGEYVSEAFLDDVLLVRSIQICKRYVVQPETNKSF